VHILTLLLSEGFFRKERVLGATSEGWLAGGTEKERAGWGGRGGGKEEERAQEVNQVTAVARDERVAGGTEEEWEEEEGFSS
jgi:hypothetical protein